MQNPRTFLSLCTLFAIFCLPLTLFAAPAPCPSQPGQSQPCTSAPNFIQNAWTFVLVPTFETASKDTARLSVEGLNHSLLFGQLLTSATAGLTGQIKQIYAWSAPDEKCAITPNDIAVLQTIEPFSLLNNMGVNYNQVSCGISPKCNCADVNTYNSPASIMQSIILNQAPGIYVVSMPAQAINASLVSLPNILDKKQLPKIKTTHQYVVATVANGSTEAVLYEEQLAPKKVYPKLDLADARRKTCGTATKNIFVSPPSKPAFTLNTNLTVSFIRHVEAHPTAAFENGNYVCAGQWRALGANSLIKNKIQFMPDNILTTNPNGIIACAGTCSYIRPTLTIAPFATEFDLKMDIAQFPWNDAESLAAALFTQNSPFSQPKYQNAKTLVAWEHVHIKKAVDYLLGTLYQNPKAVADLPEWNYTDYDSIWTISIDATGNLQFSNSCEGLHSELLPSTCPAFLSAPAS